MSTNPSKATGSLKETLGSMQQTVGSALGLGSTETEGAKKRAEGNTEVKQAKAQGYAEGTGDRLEGNVKDAAGPIGLVSSSTEAKGKAQAKKGEAQQRANE